MGRHAELSRAPRKRAGEVVPRSGRWAMLRELVARVLPSSDSSAAAPDRSTGAVSLRGCSAGENRLACVPIAGGSRRGAAPPTVRDRLAVPPHQTSSDLPLSTLRRRYTQRVPPANGHLRHRAGNTSRARLPRVRRNPAAPRMDLNATSASAGECEPAHRTATGGSSCAVWMPGATFGSDANTPAVVRFGAESSRLAASNSGAPAKSTRRRGHRCARRRCPSCSRRRLGSPSWPSRDRRRRIFPGSNSAGWSTAWVARSIGGRGAFGRSRARFALRLRFWKLSLAARAAQSG